MRRLALLLFAVTAACPPAPVPDGGSGGGLAGGSGGGGAAGGTAGGGTAGGAGGGTGGGGGGVTAASYCANQAAAMCAWAIRCGTAAPGADCDKVAVPSRISLINTRADCVPQATRAALDAGRTTLDATRAASCFDALSSTAACRPNPYLDEPSCVGLFVGTVGSGGSCYASADCMAGFYCASSASVCPGTCQPKVAAGAATTNPLACPTGTSWRTGADGGYCPALVDQGQACTTPPGEFFPLLCRGVWACQPVADGGSICAARSDAGQACSIVSEINCPVDAPCGSSDAGTVCMPLGRSAQACAAGCQAGLACTSGSCGPLVAPGGACGSDQDCIAGAFCNAASSCQLLGGLDAGCAITTIVDDCGPGLFCTTGGHCAAKLGLDAICTSGSQCDGYHQALFCTNPNDGGASRCRPFDCTAP